MLFLTALLPLLTVASAGVAHHPRSHRVMPSPSPPATSTSTDGPVVMERDLKDRGLLDGLLGGLGQTVGGLGGTVGGVVGGLGNTVGGSLGGVVTDLGNTLGGTVTTVGGVVEDVSKINLDVLVNTCVKLGTATHINDNAVALGGVASTSGGVTLAAGACVCVDASAGVSLAGASANVGVYASGGLYFNGTAAANIASSTQPGLLGLSAGVYNFDVVDTCISAQLSLSNSHHDFSSAISGGSCCARACDTGYVLTGGSKCCLPGSSLDANGNCFVPPTCSTTEILCNSKCYPRSSYTCPSGLPVAITSKRAESCPVGFSKCAVGALGANMWECVDTKSDIESCGGCMYPTPSLTNPMALSVGTDCTSIPNVSGVSCNSGACLIDSCAKGYRLNGNGTSCDRVGNERDYESRSIRTRAMRLRELQAKL
ncbi:hypothetical protein IAT40_005256 [Kwoniella sp. CBS 6097]